MEAPKFRNLLAMSAIGIGSLAISEQADAFSPQIDSAMVEENKKGDLEDPPLNLSDTQIYVLAGVALSICAAEIVYLGRREKRNSDASRNAHQQAKEQEKEQSLTDSNQ